VGVRSAREPGDDAENNVHRNDRETGERLDRHSEIGLHAKERARHSNRARRGAERRGRRARIEPPQQLLQNKHRTGDRRIEGSGKPRPRARGEQDAGIEITSSKQSGDNVSD
jgi:hypothetical protein